MKDVWQQQRDLDDKWHRVMVRLWFTWPNYPKVGKSFNEIVLYATHPNRLRDPEIGLLNSRGQKIFVRRVGDAGPKTSSPAE